MKACPILRHFHTHIIHIHIKKLINKNGHNQKSNVKVKRLFTSIDPEKYITSTKRKLSLKYACLGGCFAK